MASETQPPCQQGAAKDVDHQTYKIHDPDDFDRVTKGIKVARCMQLPSPYGKLASQELTRHMGRSISEKKLMAGDNLLSIDYVVCIFFPDG